MARLRPLPQRKVIAVLEANGFRQVRSASHLTFKKADEKRKVLTPWVPHHSEVTVFVIQHIIRQAGKDRREFE